MIWSPYQIKVVLHHYSSTEEFPQSYAPLYRPTVEKFVEDGIIIENNGEIGVTELGAALVKMWCETPLPVRTYVDPRKMENAA